MSGDVTKTGNRERGTGNGERGTGNGERGTGNGERGTGNRERKSGNPCTAVTRQRTQHGGQRKGKGNRNVRYILQVAGCMLKFNYNWKTAGT